MDLTKPEKRASIFNHWNPVKKQKLLKESKHVTTKPIITTIEVFSNDLFYEIFDYLDVYHQYKAFYYLNSRFRSLFTDTNLPLKINVSSLPKPEFNSYVEQIIMPNKYRIRSLHLSNPFVVNSIFSPVKSASNFNQLKILILNKVKPKYLLNIIHHLSSLSELQALVLILDEYFGRIDTLVRYIFSLPKLRYLKMALPKHSSWLALQVIGQIRSPVQELVIDYDISVEKLNTLLSYVPEVRRLHLSNVNNHFYDSPQTSTAYLNSLTHVFIRKTNLSFNHLQIMATNYFKQLEVLFLSISNDRTFLNASDWKQLISSTMPKLRIFDFQHTVFPLHDETNSMFDEKYDEFTSAFWCERRWFFGRQFYLSHQRKHIFFYSLSSYRKKQYLSYRSSTMNIDSNTKPEQVTCADSVDHVIIKPEDIIAYNGYSFPNATKLTISSRHLLNVWQPLAIQRIFPLRLLRAVTIESFDYHCFAQLIQLLLSTPNVHMLTLDVKSLGKLDVTSIRESEAFQKVASTNKIIDLAIEGTVYELAYVDPIIELFPQTERMTIDIYDRSFVSTMETILTRRKTGLRHLCFVYIKFVRKRRMEELRYQIESNRWLDGYSMKLIDNKLYIWW